MSIAKVGFALLGVWNEDSAFCISILRFAVWLGMVVVYFLRRRVDEFISVSSFFFLGQPPRSLYQQGINVGHLVGYQVIFIILSMSAIVEHFKLRKWIRVVLNLACPIGGARRPPNKVPRSSSRNLGKKVPSGLKTTTKASLYADAGRCLLSLRPHSACILLSPFLSSIGRSAPRCPPV